jgi:hypothetical protein
MAGLLPDSGAPPRFYYSVSILISLSKYSELISFLRPLHRVFFLSKSGQDGLGPVASQLFVLDE